MPNDQHDELWEAYYAAVYSVVTGSGPIRERLQVAVDILKKDIKLLAVIPADEFDRQVYGPLPDLIQSGNKLATMTVKEMEDFAWAIWSIFNEVNTAYENRVARMHATGVG